MEDDRVSLLEQQLAQAKLIAEEADKKYEEVGHVHRRKKGEHGPSFPFVRAKPPIVRASAVPRDSSQIFYTVIPRYDFPEEN